MKKFVIKTVFISIPIILIGIALELLLRFIPNDYKLKNSYLQNNANKIETLILGSSHTYYGIDPKFLTTNGFNAGYISQTWEYDYLILKKYIEKLENLKVVILPVSYFSLYEKLNESAENWRVKNYLLYYHIDRGKTISQYSEILNHPMLFNASRIKNYYLFNKNPIISTQLGWGTNFNSCVKNNLDSIGKLTAERHTRENKDFVEYNEKILLSITKLCSLKDVHLLLFTPPAYKSYRNRVDIRALDYAASLAKRISNTDNHCHYFNLFDCKEFQSEDFYDGDHLNELGAQKLSDLLEQKINSL